MSNGTVKIIVIGNQHTGKSSLLRKLTHDEFDESNSPTIGVEFGIITTQLQLKEELEAEEYKFHIWDTSGQERFRSITRSYYIGSHIILFVFSLNDRESFYSLDSWFTELDSNSVAIDERQILIVGTKTDTPHRYISDSEIKEYLAKHNYAGYLEISSKTGKGIPELKQKLFDTFIDLVDKKIIHIRKFVFKIIKDESITSTSNKYSKCYPCNIQ